MRRLLGFLDESVKDYDASTNESAEKGASDSFWAMSTDFEQATTHGSCTWHAKIGAMLNHSIGKAVECVPNTIWPSVDLCFDALAKEFQSIGGNLDYSS